MWGGGGFVVAQLVLQLVHLRKLLVPDWLKGNAVNEYSQVSTKTILKTGSLYNAIPAF